MDISDIKNAVSEQVYKEGVEFFLLKRNKILQMNARTSRTISSVPTHITITFIESKVLDMQNKYTQNITIITNIDNTIESVKISGKCSCSKNFTCKHIVAVLLSMLKRENEDIINSEIKLIKQVQEIKDEDKLNFWVNEFKKLTSFTEINSNKIKYKFSFKNSDKNRFQIKLYYINDNYKEEEINTYELRKIYSRNEYLTIEDKEILLLLKKTKESQYDYTNSFVMKGELGFFITKKVIETNRAFFKDKTIPISFGKDKNLQIKWKKSQTDDTYNLVTEIEQYSEILLFNPVCYLNTKNLTFGQVITNHSYEELELMNKFPTVQYKTLMEFNSVLNDILIDVEPMLKENQKLINIKTKPKYVLELYTQVDFHNIKVKYLYENYELSYYDNSPIKAIYSDDEVILIHRDTNKEKEVINLLTSLGFINKKMENNIVFINLYQPNFSTAVERMRHFLEDIVSNLNKDYIIKFDETFELEFKNIENINIQTDIDKNWFSMEISVDIDGKKVSLLPLVVEFLNQIDSLEDLSINQKLNIQFDKSKFIRVEAKTMKPIIETILAIYDGKSKKLLLNPFDATLLNFDNKLENVKYKGDMSIFEIKEKLENFTKINEVEIPRTLNATLRDYQRDGLNWLSFLREFGFGGILADDMGLGKTIQTLTLLLKEKEENRANKPSLIIAPTSLMGNWRSENAKFTPELKMLIFHGDNRKEDFENLEKFDVIVTTYNLIVRDYEELIKIEFYYLILDEAQKIKNPKTKMAQAIKDLNSKHKLCLTGTPMENHLGEIWSIFDFLMSGFLWSQNFFNENFRFPIEKNYNEKKEIQLKKRIKPFMLRRKKDDVIKELPQKTEIIRTIAFEKKQAKLYESVRITMEKKVRDIIKEKGLASSHIMILDALLKLRQVCCDPSLLKLKEAEDVKESAKLEATMELIEELIEEGRKIILFSQFSSMLSIIEDNIKAKNILYAKLTGSTTKREEVIEKFKNKDTKIFLISLKAGGVGLNLIEADTVIHYDPWWNPATEEQATDRAYRIGQDKPIFVYKMVIEGTIEEKILALQDKKRKLADAIIDNSKEKFSLTQDDISELFKPMEVD